MMSDQLIPSHAHYFFQLSTVKPVVTTLCENISKFWCPHLPESKLKFEELEGKVRFTAVELMERRIRMTITSSQRT